MAVRNTKQRIIDRSLELFNELGERNVTTNHIAADLGISPGNLYYHFRNKGDIIYALFLRLKKNLEAAFAVPQDRPMTFGHKIEYTEAIFDTLWNYRFFQRDLEHIVSDVDGLYEHYREMAFSMLGQARLIYKGLIDAGLLEADEKEIDTLVLNIWIVATSWTRFLQTTITKSTSLSSDQLRRGVYQIVSLDAPFLTETGRHYLPELRAQYLAADTRDIETLFQPTEAPTA